MFSDLLETIMMTHRILFFPLILSLLFISISAQAQYRTQSPYIDNPELLLDYVNDCASFWEGVHDDTYGGFFVEVGKTGNILNSNNKSLVSESRDAYGFTRAYMLTGNESYLDYARSALDFMYEHLWDEQYGGWYRRCNRVGLAPYQGEKTAFDQHYALLGITAYWEATNSQSDWQMLEEGYQFMDDYMWDERPNFRGYYNEVNRQGLNPYGKSFNATVDAITTHLYNLYLLTKDQQYFDRLMVMKSNIQDELEASMADQAIGFAEEYNSSWVVNNGERRTIMGHVLKTGWCMGRIYRIDQDQESLNSAKALVAEVLEKGYDHEYGGPYKDYDRITGEMYMYGASDTAKAWWQMEQAITAGFLLYEITNEAHYLKVADESLDFFMNYFVDPVYGEVYGDRARDGGRVSYGGGYWDENKGSEWKAAYHSIETAYYAYLYAKLLIKKEAADLYYNFEASNTNRTLHMNPLAVDFSKLKIDAIKLDGVDYNDFDANLRTLHIPAGTSGVFRVSYKMTGLPDAIYEHTSEQLARIKGSYPNPYTKSYRFDYQLKKDAFVEVSVFNSMGQQLETLESNHQSKGTHSLEVNSSFPAGNYYIRLQVDGKAYYHKMIQLQ